LRFASTPLELVVLKDYTSIIINLCLDIVLQKILDGLVLYLIDT